MRWWTYSFGLNLPKDKVFITNVFRDIATRPYIPWVFLQPDDTDSANNFFAGDIFLNVWNDIKKMMKSKRVSVKTAMKHVWANRYYLTCHKEMTTILFTDNDCAVNLIGNKDLFSYRQSSK